VANHDLSSTEGGAVNGGTSTLLIQSTYTKTASLSINVAVVSLSDTPTSEVSGDDSILALAKTKTASLDINAGEIQISSTATSVLEGADALLALNRSRTTSLDIAVGIIALDATATSEVTGEDSLLAIYGIKSTSLDINVGVLDIASTPTSVVTSQDTLLAFNRIRTTSLDIAVGILALDSTATSTLEGEDSLLAINRSKATSLDIAIGILALESTPTSTVADDDSLLALYRSLSATLNINVGLIPISSTPTSVLEGEDSLLALNRTRTTSLDIAVGIIALDATPTSVLEGEDSLLALNRTRTTSLDIAVGIIALDATPTSTVTDDDALLALYQTRTTSLDIAIGIIQLDATPTATVTDDDALLALYRDLSASLNINVGLIPLNSTATSVVEGEDALLALYQLRTAALDIAVGIIQVSSTATSEVTGEDSLCALYQLRSVTLDVNLGVLNVEATATSEVTAEDSVLAIVRTKTALLDVNTGLLALYSTTPGVVTGVAYVGIEKNIDSTSGGTVTGTATLRKTVEISTSLSNTIKGTETRDADLDVSLSVTYIKTSDMSAWIASTVTPQTDLDAAIAATWLLPASLDVHLSPTAVFLLPVSVTVKGTQTLGVALSVTVLGTELLTPLLDMLVEVKRPYSLTKLWGDVASRYFSGNASDSNFFENFRVLPSAVVNNDIGVFSAGDRRVEYLAPNQIPTSLIYDKYSLPLNSSLDTTVVGARVLINFQLLRFGVNASLLLGLCNGTASPTVDIATGALLMFGLTTEAGFVVMRAWASTNALAGQTVSLQPEALLNKPLLLEIETTGAVPGRTVHTIRLFDSLQSLDVPLWSVETEMTVPLTATHVAMTSLGRIVPEAPELHDAVHAHLKYVDVEPGTGSVFSLDGYYLTEAQAKWRHYLDRPPVLLNRTGQSLLEDNFDTDQGYWVYPMATTFTISGGSATVAGGSCYGSPVGSSAWSNYRVAADVTGASDTAASRFGIGLYATSDYASGDAFGFLINTWTNEYSLVVVVAGTPTLSTYSYAGFGILEPGRTYRLELDARTQGSNTRLNAFIDGKFIRTIEYGTGPTAGAGPMLIALQGTAVTFDNVVVRSGMNDVFVALSDDGVSQTDTHDDTLFLDATDPVITVTSFTTDSPVIVPDTTNPQVVKGSLNPGYSNVTIEWNASHTGTWTLRANSTGASSGYEMASGNYSVAGATVVTNWSFADLPQVDGRYDVTLYLIADSGKPSAKKLGEYLLP
jgi:hypothetical protein